MPPTASASAAIREDPLRPGLFNLLLPRNDSLLNGFEAHLLLANLGNIDWRPLVNLWSVLTYLTKYTAKSGKSSRHLATLFDNVLSDVFVHEKEDGYHDLWRRTIMKFYNRIIGDRDYTLFEVVRTGLRLPPFLSSFGNVENASVSSWRMPRSSGATGGPADNDHVVHRNKCDVFNLRGTLRRSAYVAVSDLEDISFYAFHRQFSSCTARCTDDAPNVSFLCLALATRRMPHARTRTMSITRNTRYTPTCLVRGSWAWNLSTQSFGLISRALMRSHSASSFDDARNLWCPTWIRNNYDFVNRDEVVDAEPTETALVTAAPDPDPPSDSVTAEVASTNPRQLFDERIAPRVRFELEDDPTRGDAPVDPEEDRATTLDHWAASVRPPWERHSELGANLHPLRRDEVARPWIPNINPPDFVWDARWTDIDVAALRRTLHARLDDEVETDMPHLRKENLSDDYQRLFVELVLCHAETILHSQEEPPARVPPLRLLLLGTAGTGKTHAVQTLLQELKAILRAYSLRAGFCRVAAPTGCAAFNVRFSASTVHRLFDLRKPHKWEPIPENSARLLAFQEKLQQTCLFIFDEVSMIGRQLMGKVDSRCEQAYAPAAPGGVGTLGDRSCVLVGDPAQCPPIGDDIFFAPGAHHDTERHPDAARVTLSNRGKHVFDTFRDVIILQRSHRVHRLVGDDLTAEQEAYNARGQRYLDIMARLRDCTWTEDDYYTLCRRKLGHLSFAERATFVDAPRIMEFRRERSDDLAPDTCEAFNRRLLYALAKESGDPVASLSACHDGIDQDEGLSYADEVFAGLPATLELCEGAPVILTHNLWVSAGLINGTRGTVRAIVYRDGRRPDHPNPACRLPDAVLVERPSYAGVPFFSEPPRSKWVPFFPRQAHLEDDRRVTRSQYPFVLAWALTIWKAQGMSLEKVVVHLGKAAMRPGVAFVALTRARHPDGLALDDSFPVMSTFQKQLRHPHFAQRLVFERRARVLFSATLRTHVRDASIYSAANVWTADDASIASMLLRFLASHSYLVDVDCGS